MTPVRRWSYAPLLAVLPVLAALIPVAASAQVDARLLAGLVWRNVGPFRGGRVSAVTGVIGQPGVYYMGLPIGGVWKTTSAGTTWFPIFDDVRTVSSVGAVEVAPSDPQVVYVGTGSTNDGDGVYKSTDAGRTWRHLGMDSTRRIAHLLVDPRNPDLVLMAVLGSPRGASETRGVYRSTDGGRSWTRTLYVDSATGASDVEWAYDQPDVVLASTRRALGFGPGGAAGGAGGANTTALFKSTDEGATWTEIKGGGLPALSGRLSVAVAMHTGGRRMFVVGPAGIGLWRSDDGGATWRRMAADDARIANGQGNYTSGVWVNTGNPDTVYTIATAMYRSTDGGGHFTGWKGSPGGDDPQVMWYDPTDPKRMLMGLDQGAQVSLDGGETWSSWYNQSTEQIYHLSVDTSYPYWIYATQQDACAIATRSRGDLGEVSMFDWLPNPGFERGSIVADPLDPRIVYALNMTAGIMRITYPSGQWINVAPNIDASLGLRANGDQPLAFNATNKHELLAGYQVLMATTDGGAHWRKLSPDLAAPTGAPPPEGARQSVQGPSISAISSSPVRAGVIWVGTTSGKVQVTRDHGTSWRDVSIPGTGGLVSSVDASPLDPAAAYVAIRVRNEFGPSFYRTHDYGATWTKIVAGMATDEPGGSFARVIRADTKKAGLLFAGTESTMYVSFDDGDHWQSLMLNLPVTSYRDAVVKDNDLVVATYGRGIWILDDLSPLRQMTPAVAAAPAYLFTPGDAVRVRRDVNGDTPLQAEVPHADNPPLGAVIYYALGAAPAGELTLDILDASGAVVRHFSSAPIPPLSDPPAPVADWWLEVPQPLPTRVGLNRVSWNIRYDNPPAFNHNYAQVMGAVPHATPYTPEGPLALPGTYTARLTADGRTYTETFTVRNDPRSPATAADLRSQHALQMKLYAGARESWDGWHQVATVRAAVGQAVRSGAPAEVAAAAARFDSVLARLAGDPAPLPYYVVRTGPPTFAGLNGTEAGETVPLLSMNGQLRTTDYGDLAPTESMRRAWAAGCADLRTAVEAWRTINATDLAAFNAVLTRNGLAPIAAAAPALAPPACALPAAAGSHR
ncbi:MAG TPA: hypothetical protein VEH62_02840 [Gemmatimonadales bacterium]|nr:hypothetical protein [Gemmatimonadales bacterium]